MPHKILGWLFETLLGISTLYALVQWTLVISFRKRHPAPKEHSHSFPSVSILCPISGTDDNSEALLESVCAQSHPPDEIRYGVNNAGDPGVSVVRRLIHKFPKIRIHLSIGKNGKALNPKIGNLTKLFHRVSSAIIVAIDQDIAVAPDYLKTILAPFSDPKVGMVTALYRVGPPETLGSALELLAVHADFFPSVLTAEWIEGGLRFGFGATLAIRRELLEKFGGFQSFENFLADDYEIGARVHQAGYRVALAPCIVEHHPGKLLLRNAWQRGIRAARTFRLCRPAGYALTILTQGLPWAVAAIAISGFSSFSIGFALFWAGARTGLVLSSNAVLTPKPKRRWWPMIFLPLHEAMRFVYWVLAFSGNQVSWRGERYSISANGQLQREEIGFQEKNASITYESAPQ